MVFAGMRFWLLRLRNLGVAVSPRVVCVLRLQCLLQILVLKLRSRKGPASGAIVSGQKNSVATHVSWEEKIKGKKKKKGKKEKRSGKREVGKENID